IANGLGKTLCAIRAKGNIVVTAGHDILLGDGPNNKWADIYTDAGDINLTAGRDIKMYGDSYWLGSDKENGTITFIAGGDVRLATVGFYLDGSLEENTGTVTINAGGSILDDSVDSEVKDGEIPTFIKANAINLTAGANIGGFNNDGETPYEALAPLLDVILGSGYLTAVSTGGGNIDIAEHGSLNLLTSKYRLTSNGANTEMSLVNLTENGDLTLDGSPLVGVTELRGIDLAAARDIIVSNNFATIAYHLGLRAFHNVEINASLSSGGKIQIEADTDGNGSGAITQTTGTIGSGSEKLVLYAAEGIGTVASPLQTEVAELQATNTYSGDINIINIGGLNGDLILKDLQSLSYAVKNFGSGDVNIAALTDLIIVDPNNSVDLIIEDAVITSGGALNLRASDDILQDVNTISTSGGEVRIDANYDNKGLVDFGVFRQSDGASIEAGSGNITINTADGMTISNLTTTGDVSLYTASDEILDAGDTLIDIIAGTLIIGAESGIGSDNPLEIQVNTLQATTTEGNINIINQGDLIVENMINHSPTGEVNLTVNGDLTFSGGTFTAALGSVNVNGDFSLQSGVFTTNPAAIFSVGGSFAILGGTFNRFSGSGSIGDPYLIYDVYGLQAMACYLSSHFKLHNDIDASSTIHWNSGKGFSSVGNNSVNFYGSLDGQSYTITDLYINMSTTDYVGLFGCTAAGTVISNIGLIGSDITGGMFVGGLVGWNYGSIINSYNAETVSGANYIGGLSGVNSGSIENSYNTGSVPGGSIIGGLVGYNGGLIANSYNTGEISGFSAIGGLVGDNQGLVINSYNTGGVFGSDQIGGLVGQNYGSIANSYNSGIILGSNSSIGGLAGFNAISGSIVNSYNTGEMSGVTNIGGVIGEDGGGMLINNWWYNHLFKGVGNIGSNTVTGCWQKAAAASNFYGTGSGTGGAVYIGANPWDFTNIWRSTATYPLLKWQP
ncbi:MAG: hypothetical protein MUC39_04120, partial [Candidatus Omnitrophica bacterium]|nr:hypothetical protein [Candidatus Omnitrophota bacterium]